MAIIPPTKEIVKCSGHTGVLLFHKFVIGKESAKHSRQERAIFLASINIMPITTKDSINKQWLGANGQASMFCHDNLQFKTVNHPLKHKFVELCSEFKLKKISTELKLKLNYLSI